MMLTPLRLAILIALAAPAALAQTAPTAPRDDATTLDQFVVTGTRVTDRTVAESHLADRHHHPGGAESTGTTELATALARALPSLNFPRPAISDGTDAVRPAQLRGLVARPGAGAGQRQAPPHHRAGQRQRHPGPRFLAGRPQRDPDRGDRARRSAARWRLGAVRLGRHRRRHQHRAQGQRRRRQRRRARRPYSAGDGEQYQLAGDGGFKLGDDGFVHLAAQVGAPGQDRPRAPVLRPRRHAGAPAPLGRSCSARAIRRSTRTSVSATTPSSARPTASTSIPSASPADRDALSNGFFRPAGDRATCPSIYPNGFLPQIHNVADDPASWRLHGDTAGGWNIDLSYNYGNNHLTFDIENTPEPQPRRRPRRRSSTPARWKSTQNVLNLDFSKPLRRGLAGVSDHLRLRRRVARREVRPEPGRTEFVRQRRRAAPGRRQRPPGAQVFAGFQPADAGHFDRHSYSLYAELEADLTDKFSAGIARALRGLQRLRRHHLRQAVGALRVHRHGRAARHGVHRLPRAVAAAAVLPVHRDQLHRPRRATAVRHRHLPRQRPGRDRARRRAAQGRGIDHLSLGLVLQPIDKPVHHRRRLPHRYRRPHHRCRKT